MIPKYADHEQVSFETQGTASHTQTFTLEGKPVDLILKLKADFYEESPYTTSVEAEILLDLRDGTKANKIGFVEGETIDKKYLDSKTGKPAWLAGLLTCPKWYTGDRTVHSGDLDALCDTQKVFQLLYSPQGALRSSVRDHAAKLAGQPRIHYILAIQLDDEYRKGKGFGARALEGYLQALGLLNKVHAFAEGPVILAPAPLAANWDTASWVESKACLIRFYEKSGFEMWFAGDLAVKPGISIMGRMFSPSQDAEVEAASKRLEELSLDGAVG